MTVPPTRLFPAAPVVEPAELLIQNGSNASLRCNTNNRVPDTSIQWEKLNGRVNCPNINTDSASGSGILNSSSQTLSGDGRQSGSGLNISGSGSSGLTLSGGRLPSGSGQTLDGDGELEQYQLVGNGSVFEFAPVVFGDEGCYRCVAMGVASDSITVTGRQIAYSTTPKLIHLSYYIFHITSLSVSRG